MVGYHSITSVIHVQTIINYVGIRYSGQHERSFRSQCWTPKINHYEYLQYCIYCIIMDTIDLKKLNIYLSTGKYHKIFCEN